MMTVKELIQNLSVLNPELKVHLATDIQIIYQSDVDFDSYEGPYPLRDLYEWPDDSRVVLIATRGVVHE